MRVADEIYYPMFLLLPLNLRISDLDGMVEFCYKVLAIHDPSMLLLSMLVERSTMCFSVFGFRIIVKKDECIRKLKGNADMICMGVMCLTKFSMELEIFLSLMSSYAPQS